MSRMWTPSAGPQKRTDLRVYGGVVETLHDEDIAFFHATYQLDLLPLSRVVKRAPAEGRYVLPIFDPYGHERGLVLRVPWAGAPLTATRPVPKADTYRSEQGPCQSFYEVALCAPYVSKTHERPVVLVEDQLSAIKLSAYGYNAVAFLGTPVDHLLSYNGSDRVSEIARWAKEREVIVALDPDATEDAFKFARKWSSAFKQLRVAILDKDLKDTDHIHFREVLGV